MMETGSARCSEPSDACAARHQLPDRQTSQLPTELLAEILQLTLPSTEPTMSAMESNLYSYMQILFSMRLVSKRWQEIIDGTPKFWTFVLATLPPHVNEMTVLRSRNGPLFVAYAYPRRGSAQYPSSKAFLKAVVHALPRWSGYEGPVVAEYLNTPAPLLRYINISGKFDQESPPEPLELFGGFTTHLWHIELSEVSIRWKLGMFTQLKVLDLEYMGWDGLTITHLLDFLRSSPCLEKLRLEYVHATANDGPSSHPITLHHLRSVELFNCEDDMIASILGQIRAPSCIKFYVDLNLENQLNLPRFLDEIFQPFEGILRAIHERNGLSEITIDSSSFQWHTLAEGVDNHKYWIVINCSNLVNCIRWVERILQGSLGLRIAFSYGANLSEDVLETIALMRCVTAVYLAGDRNRAEIRPIFKFLAEPLVTNPHLPSLPCFRELLITSGGWNAQDLLGMLQSRFSLFSQGTTEPPLLTIKMWRGAFHWNGRPRPILDYSTLTKIRETEGLECIQFVGTKDRDGMLAIVWGEEISQPLWSLASYDY